MTSLRCTNDPDRRFEELLGAHALGALPGEESSSLESHLEHCEACRIEARLHGETAALLGAATPTPERPDLWERIAAQLAEPTPSGAPPATTGDVPSNVVPLGRRRGPWLGLMAVAAAVLAFIVVAPRLATPATTLALVDDAGTLVAEVSLDGDIATWATMALPALGSTQTYQLWAVVDDRVISVAVLGPSPDAVPFPLDADVIDVLALTIEEAGGVAVSQQAPVALWVP